MRIAVLSDIHGNALALEAVLADIDHRDIGTICNLGDHFSGPFEPGRTFSILAARPMVAIRGNHERHLISKAREKMDGMDGLAFDEIGDAGRAWIADLPETAQVGTQLFLCHGTPGSDNTHWLFAKDAEKRLHPVAASAVAAEAGTVTAPFIGCGHTHVQAQVTLPDGRMVFNPGSVGRPAVCMADPVSAQRRSPAAQYALLETLGSGWRIDFAQVEYDHERAAAIAERNGEPVWAENLRTGWAR